MKPSLFFTDKEIIIDLFQAIKPTPLKMFETRMELRLSDGAMNIGLDECNPNVGSDPTMNLN